jgi:hypothetical protein
MTFGRPATRKPENTSKLEVGATIVVWVVGVSLWGLSFGWRSYRHHQRIDGGGGDDAEGGVRSVGGSLSVLGESTPTTSSWSGAPHAGPVRHLFPGPPPPSTLVSASTTARVAERQTRRT